MGPPVLVGARRREQAALRAPAADAGAGVHAGRGRHQKSHGLLQGHQDGVAKYCNGLSIVECTCFLYS